jgi:hypothetical protein
MMMNYNECSRKNNNSKIVLKENKSKFEISNPEKILTKQTKVDGCLIDDTNEKCDWIISYETPTKTALYVELKGCNVDKAISQLKSTLKLTIDVFGNHKRKCFAVTTRVPKSSTSTRKKCMDFYDETKATLSIKNLQSTFTIGNTETANETSD